MEARAKGFDLNLEPIMTSFEADLERSSVPTGLGKLVGLTLAKVGLAVDLG